MRVLLRRLTGPARGLQAELALPALIGSGPDADMKTEGAAPLHVRVFERRGEVVAQVVEPGLVLRLSGEELHEAVLREGDEIELGADGPRLRLEAADEAGGELLDASPWGRASSHASPRARFARWLRELSTAARLLMAAAILFGAAALGYSYWQDRKLRLEIDRLQEALRQSEAERAAFAARVADERSKSEQDREALGARIDELKQREEVLYGQIRESTAAESGNLRGELQSTRERLATLESERAVGERIVRDYGPGVALIQGAYQYQDKEGRPLRYKVDDDGNTLRDADDNPILDPEGKGEVHEVEYVGTGFMVDRRGLMLTNRHIAEPWWNNDFAQSLIERGYKPKQTALRAFFPMERRPFLLRVEGHAEHADVSLLRCETGGARLPILPLDKSGKGAVTGQAVVVVGFPAGVEAMLAKIDSAVAREIVSDSQMKTGRITEALARRGLVRPSTTQGHIADITETDVVFDAPTTQGGSGGPLLNRNGQVIGVAYAVLSRFGGNSFAVPVRRALPLVASDAGRRAAQNEPRTGAP